MLTLSSYAKVEGSVRSSSQEILARILIRVRPPPGVVFFLPSRNGLSFWSYDPGSSPLFLAIQLGRESLARLKTSRGS